MPDVFTKQKRSEVMSKIRSRGNKETELALAKLFRANGITGWRRHVQIRSAKFGVRNGRRGREQIRSAECGVRNGRRGGEQIRSAEFEDRREAWGAGRGEQKNWSLVISSATG